MRLALIGPGLFAGAALALAQTSTPTPSGMKGKDWDELYFQIESGAAVELVASNNTTARESGNTSSVILWLDDREVAREGGGRAQSEARYVVTGNNTYKARAICYNTGADAQSCKINANKLDVKKF